MTVARKARAGSLTREFCLARLCLRCTLQGLSAELCSKLSFFFSKSLTHTLTHTRSAVTSRETEQPASQNTPKQNSSAQGDNRCSYNPHLWYKYTIYKAQVKILHIGSTASVSVSRFLTIDMHTVLSYNTEMSRACPFMNKYSVIHCFFAHHFLATDPQSDYGSYHDKSVKHI